MSVLVMRHGHLVVERYYHGSDGTEERDVFSVTKSVVSALVGIVLREGRLRRLDQKVVDFFPHELESGADPRVRAITLRDLLTMTAGYRPANISSDDWVRTLLNRPLASDPGEKFAYDDGSAHLLSAVLTEVTGKRAEELAQHRLFGPLGICVLVAGSDGQGRSLGSTGLYLRPRELLMLGQLYLQHGMWRGRQIFPSPGYAAPPRNTCRFQGVRVRLPLVGQHRPAWGLRRAGVRRDQMLAVYPRLDLVVAITGAGEFDQIDALRQVLRALAPIPS